MPDKKDLRVIKTEAAIKKVFIELILESDLSSITVEELAKRAQIHRKTFYLHYPCLEALFEEMISEVAKAYYAQIDALPAAMPMKEVNRVFFEFFSAQPPYIERLLCAPEYQDLFDKTISVMLMQHNRARYNPYRYLPPEEQDIINVFLTKSSINMYRQWAKSGKKIPLPRIIELTGELLTEGIQELAR